MAPRPEPRLFVRRLGLVTKAIAVATVAQILPKRTSPGQTPALPFELWPKWAKDIAQDKARQPVDKGIGDTLVHMIGDANSEAFKARFKEWVGTSCGCADRQGWLNARFPYL